MKHAILFLAANPNGTDRRALDREAHSIQAELKRSGYGDHFEFKTRWAAEPHDLLRSLREFKPTVVHFSGQGSHDGLFFQTANGDAQVVSPAALAETFSAAGASVKLIVLSACYSAASAEALLAHVECVVGMSGRLHEDAARSFAIGFYGALGEQESIAAAYRHGNAAICLEGLSDVERPQLKVRDGFDAAQVVLAASVPVVQANLQQNQGPFLVRWIVTGIGATCLISGGVMAIRSDVPVKGVLGPLGLGVLLISLALIIDRIPTKEVGGALRWITGVIVILILGLAYASVTGIYEAVRRGPVNHGNDRVSAADVVEAMRRDVYTEGTSGSTSATSPEQPAGAAPAPPTSHEQQPDGASSSATSPVQPARVAPPTSHEQQPDGASSSATSPVQPARVAPAPPTSHEQQPDGASSSATPPGQPTGVGAVRPTSHESLADAASASQPDLPQRSPTSLEQPPDVADKAEVPPEPRVGRIVDREVMDNNLIQVWIAAPEAWGVTKDWKAVVSAGPNIRDKPVAGGEIEITSVKKTRIQGTTSLTVGQIDANPYVKLVPK